MRQTPLIFVVDVAGSNPATGGSYPRFPRASYKSSGTSKTTLLARALVARNSFLHALSEPRSGTIRGGGKARKWIGGEGRIWTRAWLNQGLYRKAGFF